MGVEGAEEAGEEEKEQEGEGERLLRVWVMFLRIGGGRATERVRRRMPDV